MKLDTEKIPSTIAKFGNTSSVSVPLTIVSELKGKLEGEKTLLLSADLMKTTRLLCKLH